MCEKYLGVDFPDQLRASGKGAGAMSATIQMLVVDRPNCRYAYTIEPSSVTVFEGVAFDAHLTLAFKASDLEAFSRGMLDADEAIRSERLKVMGDARLLTRLADRLSPEEA